MQSSKQRRMLILTWRQSSGVIVTRTSPKLSFMFTDIVIHLHGQFYHVRVLKIQEGIDTSPVFLTKLQVSDVIAFFGSQISPLCSYTSVGC